MQCLFIFSPLAGVEIEGIFLKACGVDHTKVRGVRYCQFITADTSFIRSVPRCRLADVVKSGPDKLTGYKVIFDRVPPGLTCCVAPGYGVGIVCGTLIVTCLVVLGQCIVDTTAVARGSSLRSNDLPVRMSIMDTTHSSHRIVGTCKTFSVLCQNCRNLITELCCIGICQSTRIIIADCDRSGLIDRFDIALHVLCVLFVLAWIGNTEVQLISDIPDDNGWIVLVTLDI